MSKIFGSACIALLVAASSLSVACSGASDDTTDQSADEIASRSAHFETFVGLDGQHYFSLVAGNGENVLRSEGYTSEAAAKKGIASVVANGTDTSAFEILEASNGEWYTNLRAANHEIIGTSELYSSKSNATRGASTVRALVKLLTATPGVSAAPRVQRFEVFAGEDKKFYFRLRTNNGEIVLASQGYTAKASAVAGIASVIQNGVDAENFDLIDTADGQVAFDLKAANGEIIGRSETYVSASNATRAVQTCVTLLGERLPVSE